MKLTCWLTLAIVLEYRVTAGGKSQLCEIESGRSNIIVDIPESRGKSTDQITNPFELPINGDVGKEIVLQLTRNDSVFALNRKKLIVIEPVDRDEAKLNHIVLQISCTVRSSNKRRLIPVIVRISDINDNAPFFVNTPYEITISEATPVGSTVFRDIRAEDKDAGVNGLVEYFTMNGENYSLKSNAFSDDGFKTFEIAYPHQGLVTLSKTLDFEKIQRFYLKVVASDRARNSLDRLSSTTTLTINVADSDDLDPSFIYRGCKVHEGACVNPQYTANLFPGKLPRLMNVFPERIQAIDLDSLNTPIKYSLLSGKPDNYNDFIEIDADSGQLKQVKAVDESTAKEYEIIIKAEENSEAKRFTTAKLTILVKPVDENPPVLSASDILGFVHENSPKGTTVIDTDGQPVRFRITDADLSNEDSKPHYTYELTTPYFAVSSENTLIVNDNNLDRDPPNADNYTFQVVARESSRNAASSPLTLTVHLIDVNDNPPKFLKAYPVVVLTAESKKLVTTVEARDIDVGKNAIVKYSIYHVSNNGASIFSINETTGQIETLSRMPPGVKYSLTIRATDRGGLYSQVVVEVIASHERNTKPPNFFNPIYEIEVREDVKINTTVLVVQASDPENDAVSYSIISGNDLRQFAIGRENGRISVIRKLDRESLTRYQLIVRAQNQGALSSSCIVNIRVVDVNDESPQFDKSTYYFFAEEERKTHAVGSVHAIDADEGVNAQIQYLLPRDVPFKINSDTGEILTRAKLDYETQQKYKFIVIAKDSSTLSRSGTTIVIVTVKDVQDESPRFEEPRIITRVPENLPNYNLLPIKAIDMDGLKKITYILRRGSGNLFKVDAKSGQIQIIQGLDYERKRNYELYVGTFENSKCGSEDFVKIMVVVEDTNDNTPIFISSPEPIIINNDVEVGVVLGKVSAIDGDGTSPSNKVQYELIGRGKAVKYFSVNESLGTIQILNAINDVTDTEYQIVLRAHDMGKPMLSSVVTVPVLVRRLPISNIKIIKEPVEKSTFQHETRQLSFKNSCYEVNVSEKTELKTTLKFLELTIQGKASKEVVDNFECTIVAGNELKVFEMVVHHRGCNLVLVKKLDFGVTRKHTLEIKLMSNTFYITPDKSVVTVNIFVLNENDKSPEFVFKEFLNRKSKNSFYGVVDKEAEVGSAILKVTAIYHDAGMLGVLKYTIKDGIDSFHNSENLPSTYFSIGEVSGILITRKKFKKVEGFPLQFLVAVHDNNGQTSSKRAHAKIVVNMISNENRLFLIFSGVVLSELEYHCEEFENMLNKYAEKLIIIIERVSYKSISNANKSTIENDHPIEMLFYAIDIKTEKILPTNSAVIANYFFDSKSQSNIKLQATKIMKTTAEVIGIFNYFEPKYYTQKVLTSEENSIEVFKYVAIIISMIILALGTAGILYIWISKARLDDFYKERRSFPPSHNMPFYSHVESGFQQVREPRNFNEFETHVSTFTVPVHAVEASSSPASLKKSGNSHLMQNNVKGTVSEEANAQERDVRASYRANVKNVVRQRTLRKIYSTDISNQLNETDLYTKKTHPNTLTLGRLKHTSNDYANIASSYSLGSRSFFKRNYLVSGAKTVALEARDSEKMIVYTVNDAHSSGASNDKIVLARYGLSPLAFPNMDGFDRSETETTTEL